MIHLVTASTANIYAGQLDAMHRLRWRVYVEERGWRELRAMQREQGVERDGYDDERAHYLLALSDEGDVLGGMRLRPAEDRSLLMDRFAHLIAEPATLVVNGGVWELTRLLRAPLSRAQDGAVRFAMNCGLIEFCLSRGVSKLVATGDTFLLPMTRKAWGAKVRPLGLPQPYEEGEVIALELTPDAEALAAMRQAGAIGLPQLFEHPIPWRDGDHDPLATSRAVRALHAAPGRSLAALAASLSRFEREAA